jgi:hypothetical protein
MMKAQSLVGEKKPAEAVAALDAALAADTDPGRRGSMLRHKFNILCKSDEPAAYALARTLLDGEFKDSEQELSSLCDLIATSDELKHPDAPLAVALGERANQVAGGKSHQVLHRLAGAYFKAGQTDKAVQTEQAAIDLFIKQAGEARAAVMVGIMKQRIEDWKKSAGKP